MLCYRHMHKVTTVISAQDQVKIAQAMLELSERAKDPDGARELQLLTGIIETLAPYADETRLTIMFDLGEYLFESSRALVDPTEESTRNREYVKASLMASLRAWEKAKGGLSA